MKTAVLCGVLLVCSPAAFAQTPAAPAPAAPHSITLTGCVGGGSNAQPITLANALVVPGGDVNAAASPSPVPGAVSAGATQPPGAAAGTPGAVGTSGTAGAAGTAGATGTSGVGTPAGGATAAVGTPTAAAGAGVGTPAAAGAAGTSGTVGGAGQPTYGTAGVGAGATAGSPAAGSAGTIAGTAPAGSSTSSVSGYRLTGADMTGWIGRRVQIVGSVVPMAAGASVDAAAAPMPEFRVVTVQPVTGDCPRQ